MPAHFYLTSIFKAMEPTLLDLNNFDDYDSYCDNFETVEIQDKMSKAKDRRTAGARKLSDLADFKAKVNYTAEGQGIEPEELHARMLKNNPDKIALLRGYLRNRGYNPSNNFGNMCAQVSHARNEHIGEVIDNYSMDNYDADYFIFDSKERKRNRKEKRTAKFERRKKRRAAKERNKMAEIDKDYANINKPEEQTQEIEDVPPTDVPVYKKQVQVKTLPDMGMESENDVLELASPNEDQAHAEIIGEEMDSFDSYDGGSDEYDNFLPFLAGAMEIGAKVVQGAKDQGVTGRSLAQLFSKKSGTPPNINANSMGDALNQGIKKIVKGVEDQKKKEFLKDNILYILLAIIIIFFIGYKIAKK